MYWTIFGGLIVLILPLWAAGSIAHGVLTDRTGLREEYRRPAAIPYPSENLHTEAKAELGQMLFFDPILSGSHSRSCATCHNPSLAWGDGLARAVGERQVTLALRSPTLLNVAWAPRLGWEGKFADLESVAFGPITSPANMNLQETELIKRLSAIPGLRSLLRGRFWGWPDSSSRDIEAALATYERSIVSGIWQHLTAGLWEMSTRST